MARVTQSAFAKEHGYTHQYINQLVKQGIIKKYHHSMIDPAQANRALKSRPETKEEAMASSDKTSNKERKERAEADIKELQRDELRGKLGDLDLMLDLFDGLFEKTLYSIRQIWLRVPTKYMPKILNLKTMPQAQAALEKMVETEMKKVQVSVDVKKILTEEYNKAMKKKSKPGRPKNE